MSEIDNPPAFPFVCEGGEFSGLYPELERGMTLRDWFAGQALASGLINPCDYRDAAGKAYIVADAMLAERAKARGEKVIQP